ncbi:MAG: hydroxyphenylacetyl-CoA thioesterase PaaI [Burkholderiaceae bacterium]|nr:hydroxyphenylacetyl-CoA thioesterase PaaI [Burkholderiaceae bacterium]
MTESTLNPQQIADAVALGMMAKDQASRGLGMRLTHISPGSAHIEMRVRDDMLNGFDICHGGFITLLADSAFAFACNSYNELTVASSLAVDFLAPVRGGDVLTARAAEVSLSGRTGVYDVEVCKQGGVRVAIFRGRSYRMKGKPVVTLPTLPASAD